MQLDRKQVIQNLIDAKGFKVYLEIGVFLGKLFFDISAKYKIAVDPNVKFSRFKLLKRSFKYKNNTNLFARSFKLASDDFFAKKASSIFKRKPVDICLVDGMHEYRFALRDVENTLKYLRHDGVVIMHDCNPVTKQAASNFEDWNRRGFKDDWNGDVWKAILHLRSTRSDINVFVLNTDQGLGIITKGKPQNQLNFTGNEILNFTYEDLEKNRVEWLNLKEPSYFFEYFNISR